MKHHLVKPEQKEESTVFAYKAENNTNCNGANCVAGCGCSNGNSNGATIGAAVIGAAGGVVAAMLGGVCT